MPTVLIWSPNPPENTYGHAALVTDNYYMSFWPNGDVKNELGVVSTATVGVEASIHYHNSMDYVCEGKRKPATYDIKAVVSDAEVDRVYEEFLRFNNINPEEVTLEAGCQKIANKQNNTPEKTLPKTLYKFTPTLKCKPGTNKLSTTTSQLMSPFIRLPMGMGSINALAKGVNEIAEYQSPESYRWYCRAQSCTSFCYHLINWTSRYPLIEANFAISALAGPILANSMFPIGNDDIPSFSFTVPLFEGIVKSHYMTEPSSSSKSSDTSSDNCTLM